MFHFHLPQFQGMLALTIRLSLQIKHLKMMFKISGWSRKSAVRYNRFPTLGYFHLRHCFMYSTEYIWRRLAGWEAGWSSYFHQKSLWDKRLEWYYIRYCWTPISRTAKNLHTILQSMCSSQGWVSCWGLGLQSHHWGHSWSERGQAFLPEWGSSDTAWALMQIFLEKEISA